MIKPNLILKRAPEEAATTHPVLVRAVIETLQKYGVKQIVIAESPGGLYTPARLQAVYAGTGMAEVARETGVKLNLDTSYREVDFPEGLRCRRFPILTPVLEADLIVNIAKLKTHSMTGISGACKNLFGLIPGLIKPELHCRFPDKSDFGDMLVDLCELIRPAINLIDGIVAMEGNGPTGGSPREMGVLIGSRDAYAADRVLCDLIGFPPEQAVMLESAVRRGLTGREMDDILFCGDAEELFCVKDFKMPDAKSSDFADRLPAFLRRPVKAIWTPKPVIRTKDCIGCGRCAESCPQHTISIREKKAVIDYKKCIKCFCCHEMCPAKAIDIKKFRLFHFGLKG